MKKKPAIGIGIAVLVFGILFGIASLPDEVLENSEVTISENSPTVSEIKADAEAIVPMNLPEETPAIIEPVVMEPSELEIPEPQPEESVEPEITEPEIVESTEPETPEPQPVESEEPKTPEPQTAEAAETEGEGKIIKVSVSDGVGARQR